MDCAFNLCIQDTNQYVLPLSAAQAEHILHHEGSGLQGIVLDWRDDADSAAIATVYRKWSRHVPFVPLAFRSGCGGKRISEALGAYGVRVVHLYPEAAPLAQIVTDLMVRHAAIPNRQELCRNVWWVHYAGSSAVA